MVSISFASGEAGGSKDTERCEKMYLDDDFKPRCDGGDDLLGRLFGENVTERERESCACEPSGCGVGEFDETWGLRGKPVAMVYSVLQDFDGLYDKDKALMRGTLFEALDLPFGGSMGGRVGCGGMKNETC